jgi:hypothetical protein
MATLGSTMTIAQQSLFSEMHQFKPALRVSLSNVPDNDKC